MRKNFYSIAFPLVDSEFEIQAFLHSKLNELGFVTCGECYGIRADKDRMSLGRVRFDLVVFINKKASLIIEVKRRNVLQRDRARQIEHRQFKKYRKFRLPIAIIRGMSDATKFIEKISTGGIEPTAISEWIFEFHEDQQRSSARKHHRALIKYYDSLPDPTEEDFRRAAEKMDRIFSGREPVVATA